MSEFSPTGILPSLQAQLVEHGVDMPRAFYEAADRLEYDRSQGTAS